MSHRSAKAFLSLLFNFLGTLTVYTGICFMTGLSFNLLGFLMGFTLVFGGKDLYARRRRLRRRPPRIASTESTEQQLLTANAEAVDAARAEWLQSIGPAVQALSEAGVFRQGPVRPAPTTHTVYVEIGPTSDEGTEKRIRPTHDGVIDLDHITSEQWTILDEYRMLSSQHVSLLEDENLSDSSRVELRAQLNALALDCRRQLEEWQATLTRRADQCAQDLIRVTKGHLDTSLTLNPRPPLTLDKKE